ncbi:HNH endonuclease signature motif containing protein [Lacrimispora amygdalina]|uniref:HNH endonuclease signature motif containing protein n=1 Tax=Lacrimispora amygdalina TaxID=253257 RepID=UPI001A9A4724|nr:HNH endonuclease signature motif containing protein [Lacrimispora amygdalina]
MNSRYIAEDIKKRLYAESMGRCMNPACQKKLFSENGDIIEKAHIDPYCETADNTFENLVLLCPNCHTNFDKNHAFTPEEVLGWKKTRGEEVERIFSKKFSSFEELKKAVVPLLEENKAIYENYYLHENKSLWNKFEIKMLQNNRKLQLLFSSNLSLIQSNQNKSYSNLEYIRVFIAHVEEFQATRSDAEKTREILFPVEINSIFGIAPVVDSIIPSVESLELLIEILIEQNEFERIVMGVEHPYICIYENGKATSVFLDDTPRLRQMYYDYKCFRSPKVRLDSLNFALRYIRSRSVSYKFLTKANLREIIIQKQKMIFVYEYCLSQAFLTQLSPEENSVIVNLHNWNGESCISHQAYSLAEDMNVRLLTMNEFYRYINEIKK